MTDAERLHRLAILILRNADDAERVRELAGCMPTVTADAMDAATAATVPPIDGKPSAAAIARCGRRAPA